MKTKRKNQQGFTLIELLVVIAIIAILASISLPNIQKAQTSAKRTKAMKEAKGIGEAVKAWSNDNELTYPFGDDANQAFAELFPDFGKETPFFVQGSAWHGTGRFKKGPDNVWGEDEDGGSSSGLPLEAGENHWAYNNLADTDSGGTIPLLADGFSRQVGVYAKEKQEVGGVWRGKKAIIVFCDFSSSVVNLKDLKYINEKANNRDEFARSGVEMVNPANPGGG